MQKSLVQAIQPRSEELCFGLVVVVVGARRSGFSVQLPCPEKPPFKLLNPFEHTGGRLSKSKNFLIS